MAKKISQKVLEQLVIGNATLVETGLYLDDELEDTICHVQCKDGGRIGGYTSIADALRHRCEWQKE